MAGNDMAHKIKELRKAKNMTLEDVAKIVGVGKSTVRKWETGMIANMRRDKIAALAKALDTTPTYLMGWDEYIDKEDAEFIKSLGYIHPKEELPPEIEAINTLLYPYGMSIMKTEQKYYFDEAGELTEDELSEFIDTIETMIHSAASALIKKKTNHNIRNIFNRIDENI